MMDVQLGHQVAECGNIDLVGMELFIENHCQHCGFARK